MVCALKALEIILLTTKSRTFENNPIQGKTLGADMIPYFVPSNVTGAMQVVSRTYRDSKYYSLVSSRNSIHHNILKWMPGSESNWLWCTTNLVLTLERPDKNKNSRFWNTGAEEGCVCDSTGDYNGKKLWSISKCRRIQPVPGSVSKMKIILGGRDTKQPEVLEMVGSFLISSTADADSLPTSPELTFTDLSGDEKHNNFNASEWTNETDGISTIPEAGTPLGWADFALVFLFCCIIAGTVVWILISRYFLRQSMRWYIARKSQSTMKCSKPLYRCNLISCSKKFKYNYISCTCNDRVTVFFM